LIQFFLFSHIFHPSCKHDMILGFYVLISLTLWPHFVLSFDRDLY